MFAKLWNPTETMLNTVTKNHPLYFDGDDKEPATSIKNSYKERVAIILGLVQLESLKILEASMGESTEFKLAKSREEVGATIQDHSRNVVFYVLTLRKLLSSKNDADLTLPKSERDIHESRGFDLEVTGYTAACALNDAVYILCKECESVLIHDHSVGVVDVRTKKTVSEVTGDVIMERGSLLDIIANVDILAISYRFNFQELLDDDKYNPVKDILSELPTTKRTNKPPVDSKTPLKIVGSDDVTPTKTRGRKQAKASL
ncbi:hypothetical protein IQ235_13610 [Oscillatoriales cyanobacterium LEGE 11467]|uniref:Uncharacterized protein n=2 Tax=Zarconia TaxID=2992130 RepID=A0A928VX29_9CYAN|nr:hypothetical protein [Zarconia navalis LEGE 11467]